MKRNAFTLVETMVVVAIIAVLTAILIPVFSMAKTKSRESVSVSNMRQLHLAVEMYRADYPGVAYGSMEAMGLPDGLSENLLGKSVKGLKPPTGPYYYYYPIPENIDRRDPTSKEYTLIHQDKTVLVSDPWFNPLDSTPPIRYYWSDSHVKKYVFGITLGGSLRKKSSPGSLDLAWWDR